MRARWRSGALAGSLGGLLVVLAGLALRPLAGVSTLPEILLDRLVHLTPGFVFGVLIDRLQYAGRPLLYSSLLLAEIVVLAIVGALVAELVGRSGQEAFAKSPRAQLQRMAALAIVLWLIIGLVVLPLAGLGVFATGSRFASGAILWGYLLEAVLYSVVTLLILAVLDQRSEQPRPAVTPDADPLRRQLAGGVAIITVATLGGVFAWRYRAEQAPVQTASTGPAPAASPGATPAPAGAPVRAASTAATATSAGAAGTTATASPTSSVAATVTASAATSTPVADAAQAPFVTPADAFYVVSKNLVDPVVKAADWHLGVKGMVRTPLILSYEKLLAMPAVEQYRTLECISNDVGGSLMSNALWRGVPLTTLLDQAGADPTAGFVLFKSVDDYTESLPMAVARQATTLIAYQMNGAALPPQHGFPARVILAGRYGMKNPKWLTDITVSKDNSQGFWEQQGWDEQAVVRTTSRIDTPKDGTTVQAGTVSISGVAFAGDRGIRSVQVSIQPDGTWQEATLQPAVGESTWVAWSYRWQPRSPGSYQVRVRAVDGTGAPQDAHSGDSFPSGATGLQAITVQVR